MKNFRIDISDDEIRELKLRLQNARWPDEVLNSNWEYGTNLGYLRELCDYWQDKYSWKEAEKRLNEIPQYRVEIDGYYIHFIYVKGTGSNCIPLLLNSGWPSSFTEYEKIIGPLTNPQEYRSTENEAFDLIIPSMPGFGFSSIKNNKGFIKVENIWIKLMSEILGYKQFYAHGTDIGARVVSDLARYYPEIVKAIHIGSVDLDWPVKQPSEEELSKEEQEYIRRVEKWDEEEGAYAAVQSTTPKQLLMR